MIKEVIKQQKELCLKQKKWFEEFKQKENLINKKIKEKQYEMGNTST